MAITATLENNKLLFLAVGNVEGIDIEGVIENLNQLEEIFNKLPTLKNLIDLDFNELKELALNYLLLDLENHLAMYFDHNFVDVLIHGTVIFYNNNEDECSYSYSYSDTAFSQINII